MRRTRGTAVRPTTPIVACTSSRRRRLLVVGCIESGRRRGRCRFLARSLSDIYQFDNGNLSRRPFSAWPVFTCCFPFSNILSSWREVFVFFYEAYFGFMYTKPTLHYTALHYMGREPWHGKKLMEISMRERCDEVVDRKSTLTDNDGMRNGERRDPDLWYGKRERRTGSEILGVDENV